MKLVRFAGLVFLCAVPLIIGCGSGGNDIKVQGKVHRKGQPLQVSSKVPGGSAIEIGFYPEKGGDPKIVLADTSTGAFRMDTKGVPPGKYKVAVHHYDPRPEDKLKGAFSKEKTPISVEIASKDQEIDIDLAKYEK